MSLFVLLVLGTSAFAEQASPFVFKTNAVYPTVAMRGGKLEKDKKKGVVYLTEEDRAKTVLYIVNGMAFDYIGTAIPQTVSKNANHNNYVMDAAGNFYLFDEFTHPEIRHGSIFAGGPVAGAGEIIIKGGRVTYIDSNSGHYPSTKVYENVKKQLELDGVDVQNVAF